jgi:hypothetical protein
MRSSKWRNCSRPQGEVRAASPSRGARRVARRVKDLAHYIVGKDDLANQDIQPGDIVTEHEPFNCRSAPGH